MIAVKQMFRCEIEQQRSLFKIPCFADISFHPDFLLHGLFTCVFCGKCKYVYNKTPQGIFKVKENVATVSYDEFQKLVNKAKSLLHTTFYVQLLTLKSKHFTVTLEVKREVYREMDLSQFGSRGKGRRGAGGREKGNGKETQFWKRGECGEAEEAKNRSVVGRPWQQQQSERGKQRCRVSRINVRQCDTSEKQKRKRLKTGGGSVGGWEWMR